MPIRPRTPPKPRTGFLRHWTLWAWFVLAVVLSVGGVCLWRSGRWLVHEDAFGHVKWAVVLAGESRDLERTDAAIRLFQEGRIDTLVLSATRIFKNRYESEFVSEYAIRQGIPRDRVFEFRQDAYSTQEEARLLVRQFRLQNLDTVLIITSSYHTARTRRIFRKLAQGYPVVLVAAADYHLYDPNAWWSNRESRKIWFDEWARTFFTAYELWRAHPETGKAEYQGLTPDPYAGGTGPLPPAPSEAAVRAVPDSAIGAAGKTGAAGKDGPKEPGADSLKSGGRGAEADSSRSRKDSAQASLNHEAGGKAAEAKEEPGESQAVPGSGHGGAGKAAKDTAAAEAARSAHAPSASSHEAGKDAEAKKAPAHGAKKPQTPPKPAPKRDDKKSEKTKKKT